MTIGLTHVPTDRLRALLAALHRGAITVPVTPPTLMLEGFHDVQDRLATLAGLDAQALRVVLVVALAERERAAAVARSRA